VACGPVGVSSLMALWRIQHAIQPPLRSMGLKNVLKLHASAESERRRDGTLLGGDTEDQIEDAVKHCWRTWAGVSEDGKRKRKRVLGIFLFAHSIPPRSLSGGRSC
jgi:hypothetical protein